ncbi:MAG: PKD domain-containing protein [Deltaproteobacteria bacterium]|nr:PKD domain-containing protein [Deltaproteobacteria bacterium]
MRRELTLKTGIAAGRTGAFTVSLALAGLASCAEPVPPRQVVAPQEPVASLVLPAGAQAGLVLSFDASASLDVDAALLAASLDFGDGAPAEAREGDASTWRFEHRYASAGRYVVQLEVTDEQGLVGRARLPLVVAPPPDQGAPVLDALVLRLDGAELDDGARVPVGASVELEARARDAEGNLVEVDVELQVAAGATSATTPLFVASGAGPQSVTGTLLLEEEGTILVRASALDAFGNRSAPRVRTLLALGPDTDSDGDGLPDLDDPAPEVPNGLRAELFALEDLFDEGIPTDLLGNQRAERVVEAITDATPLATRELSIGYLSASAGEDVLGALFPEAPALGGGFVLRFAGFLSPPAAADAVRVEIGADDIGVVLLSGVPVASADEEFARDFFRLDRVPAASDDVAMGGRAPLEIILANGEGPAAWDLRFRFLALGQSVMVPEAVGPAQFTVH